MKTNIENRLLNIFETECQNIGVNSTDEQKELFLDLSYDILILEFNLSCEEIEALLILK